MPLEPVAPEQLAFERLASLIWRGAAKRTHGEAHLLASLSPLAVRVPDSRFVWHPALRASSRGALVRSLLAELGGALLRGAAKLLRGGVRFEVATAGSRGGGLLVVPSALGKLEAQGRFTTPYIELDPEREALVFGPPGTCGRGAQPVRVGVGALFGLAVRLKVAGLVSAVSADGPVGDRMLLLLEWLVWVAGLRFAYDLALARALEARIEAGNVPVIGSVHELNSIGRTIWAVAARHDVPGRALQHAEITSGKRWYFPLSEELAAGVSLPAEFVVYDSRLAEELAPHLPGVRFRLGCSQRYALWKRVAPAPRTAGGVALFVGALAPFDNDVVLGALERIAEARPALGLAVRLHPAAEVLPPRARALARLEATGAVEVSRGLTLAEDLARASVVIGMSTTVLEEALLTGCPAVQLTDPDFLAYIDLHSVAGATRLACEKLDAAALTAAAATDPASIAAGAAEIEARLGLGHAIVTHAALLDGEPLSWADTSAPN